MTFMDMTFCSGDGCKNFATCPRALTEKVLLEAKIWSGGIGAGISQFATPRKLECYSGDGKQFLAE